MNKAELIAAVAEKAEVGKKDTKVVVDALMDVIKETVASGDDVRLLGFGTFTTREIPERTGTVNFESQKGKTWVSSAHKVPKFKAGKEFKSALI